MHVVIAGAGVGGLCLAQGLLRRGIEVTVLEAAPGIVQAGYRLHMNADGGHALRDCLPAEGYELYRQTSRSTPRRELLVFLDSTGAETGTRPHIGSPNDEDLPHTAANRRTLRQILLSGIEDRVRFGVRVTGFRETATGVIVDLADGGTVEGDLLVGADGLRSVVRAQLLGAPEVVDTGIDSLYARTPLPDELAATLPPELFDGFVFAIGPDGRFLTFGAYQPRRPVREAAAELMPGASIDPVDPYMQITMNIPVDGHLGFPDGSVHDADPHRLKEFWIEAVRGWNPAMRGLVEDIEEESIFPSRFVGLRPTPAWPSGRVTVLGDAVHAMPPSFGAGANTALRDAATLAIRLGDAVRDGTSPVDAVGAFESEMRGYAYPILEAALNPRAFAE